MSSTSRAASATSNDFFFGWDLLFRTIDRDINKKSDVLIALLHFVLMKHFKLRCIGVGEDKTFSEEDDNVGSELLPEGWNDDDKKYALRYLYNSQLYLLLGHKSEDCLIINLLDVKTNTVSNIALNPNDLVKHMEGSLNKVVPDASQLVDRYRKELVDPVFSGTAKEVSTQTNVNNRQTSTAQADPDNDPLRIGVPRRPALYGHFNPSGMIEPRPFGFPEVGRSDLDPIGRIGNGNLFPFPSHPDFRGSGQPRFDPFGPPDREVRRGEPNPDHARPPSFGGDYFS